MQTDHGEAKKKFADKISIADGIDAILAYARKTEVAGDAFAIENNGRSGERPGAEGKNVCSRETITKAIRIALQGLHLPEQVMRKSDRLRSEEHTSELQSLRHLVCRLRLEKKKTSPDV